MQKTKILFTGDFYGGYRIESLVLKGDYDTIFGEYLPIIRENDISITNLESPLTNSVSTATKTGPAIKASTKTAEAIKYAGFNMVTLANNHIMDYGAEGLKETLKTLQISEIETVGAGMNFSEASKPMLKTINNNRIAFINIAENEWSTTVGSDPGANPLDPIANYYDIRKARQDADFVFVILHGGNEMHNLPSIRMRNTCRFFVDAGANAVICHHSHCPSGYEMYNKAPIFYSLGNFLFDSLEKKLENWYLGYGVQFEISANELTFNILPYKQNQDKVGIRLLTNLEKEKFDILMSELNSAIVNDEELNKAFEKYCQHVKLGYNYYLEPHPYPKLYGIQRRGFFPSLLSKKKRRLLKNLVRCEAHRDVILKIL